MLFSFSFSVLLYFNLGLLVGMGLGSFGLASVALHGMAGVGIYDALGVNYWEDGLIPGWTWMGLHRTACDSLCHWHLMESRTGIHHDTTFLPVFACT
jgi:hypothetical protein